MYKADMCGAHVCYVMSQPFRYCLQWKGASQYGCALRSSGLNSRNSERYFSCLIINRTTMQRLEMAILGHFLRFQATWRGIKTLVAERENPNGGTVQAFKVLWSFLPWSYTTEWLNGDRQWKPTQGCCVMELFAMELYHWVAKWESSVKTNTRWLCYGAFCHGAIPLSG